MSETPRVEAFITAKQDAVLARARDTVAATPADDLAAQVHRLIGTLGTFGLDDAAAALRPLDTLFKASTTPPPDEVAELRDRAERDLADIIAARHEEG